MRNASSTRLATTPRVNSATTACRRNLINTVTVEWQRTYPWEWVKSERTHYKSAHRGLQCLRGCLYGSSQHRTINKKALVGSASCRI